MNFHCTIASSTLLRSKSHGRRLETGPPLPYSKTSLQNRKIGDRLKNSYNHWFINHKKEEKNLQARLRASAKKEKPGLVRCREELPPAPPSTRALEKKGTIAGAVALLIGTSIGSGILALPEKASPAGLFPSSISIILCWVFLMVEALVLVEISVVLRRKKNKKTKDGEMGMEVISIRTMAQDTLGDWGGALAAVFYVFFCYTSMIAYTSKSGEILFHSFNLPVPISGTLFTLTFTMLISMGRTTAIVQVNQWLTACMIGLLVAIEVLASQFVGWLTMEGGGGDWGKVPSIMPIIIFSLVYHDVIPVLCAYLGGDLLRLRVSVFLGSFLPLLALLNWDAIALGLSMQADQVGDPVEFLMRVRWSGVSYMVELFSLLAVGTSILGTLLSFSEFFKEQLSNMSLNLYATESLQEPSKLCKIRKWWEMNKISFIAMVVAVGPSLLVSTTNPDSFSTAMDIAGGYCLTMLYGVLPPAMAWAMHNRESEDTELEALLRSRPALLGIGLFACGIMVEQVLQDILKLQS